MPVDATAAAALAQLPRAERRAFLGEIATRDRTYDHWSLAGWLPNPDPILKALGKDIATYRDMRADAHIGGCIRRRKAAVRGLESSLEGQGTPARVLKDLEAILADLWATPDPDEPGAQPGLPALIASALDGALYGYQPLEILWGKIGGRLVPQAVQGKPPEWFHFDASNRLRFRDRNAGADGLLLPPRKFLLARQEPTYQNPYGLPDLAMCYWPWQFRRAAKFWLTWLERYGGDFLIGKLPRAASAQEYQDLTERLEAMIQDSVAAIPDDGSVEVLASANKAGSTDAHERFLLYWRGEISIALLGTNQGTEQTSTLASATAALDVAQDIRDGDARLVEAVVNQLLRWTCALNWPGVRPPVWTLREQEEIDTTRPARDKILVEAGAKLTRAYWLKTYDLEEEDLAPEATEPEMAGPGAEAQAAGRAAGADGQRQMDEGRDAAGDALDADDDPGDDQDEDEDDAPDAAPLGRRPRARAARRRADLADPPANPDGQDLIDAELARDASPEQQAAMERLLAPILTALADGLTPEAIMARMDEWYGALDDSLLTELLTRGLAAADAIGRLEVAAEARP